MRRHGVPSLLAAAVVGGAVLAAHTVANASWPIGMAVGVLVALAMLGGSLWSTAPDRRQATANLGTGLLVSVVVAGAVGGAQFAIDDRRRDVERRADERLRAIEHQQGLRLTVGREVLRNIDLSGEDLRGFYFARKDLRHANLRDANLSDAVLNSATLRAADLSGSTLHDADLGGADLSAVPIDRTDRDRINLAGADFRGANLRDANLTKTELHDVNLIGARLNGATLDGVTLSGRYAQLDRADLRGASLYGANLRAASLQGAKLQGSRCDSATGWPEGFDHVSAGAVCE